MLAFSPLLRRAVKVRLAPRSTWGWRCSDGEPMVTMSSVPLMWAIELADYVTLEKGARRTSRSSVPTPMSRGLLTTSHGGPLKFVRQDVARDTGGLRDQQSTSAFPWRRGSGEARRMRQPCSPAFGRSLRLAARAATAVDPGGGDRHGRPLLPRPEPESWLGGSGEELRRVIGGANLSLVLANPGVPAGHARRVRAARPRRLRGWHAGGTPWPPRSGAGVDAVAATQ